MKNILKEFKDFALKGNVLDMAVGIILGAAFGTVVRSMVDDIIMPPVGLLLGGVDFSNLFITLKDGAAAGPYASLIAARAAGAVTVNAGIFINNLISFTIVSLAVFMMVRSVNKVRLALEGPEVVNQKECPFCCSTIPSKAIRCPNCTSALDAAPPSA